MFHGDHSSNGLKSEEDHSSNSLETKEDQPQACNESIDRLPCRHHQSKEKSSCSFSPHRHRSRTRSPYRHRQSHGSYRSRSRSAKRHRLSCERSPHSHQYFSSRESSPYLSQRSYRSHHSSQERSSYSKTHPSHRHRSQTRSPYWHQQSHESYRSHSRSSNRHSRHLERSPQCCEKLQKKISPMESTLRGVDLYCECFKKEPSPNSSSSLKNLPDNIFPMSTEKFQKCVLSHLLDIKELLSASTAGNNNSDSAMFTQMSTLEELEQFNISILDLDTRKIMVSMLTRMGGAHFKDVVNNIMNRLMTNDLMCQLNMKGSRGTKKGFSDMPVCSMITDCVLQVQPQATALEITEAICLRLKYAPKRRRVRDSL